MVQLYALDDSSPVLATRAVKTKNYFCPECQGVLRLRRGPSRQPHFYHLKKSNSCRSQGKTLNHLQLQLKLLKVIGEGVHLEYPFPTIGRIADVAWHSRKIVFEIQCSPISVEEVKARIADYQQEGYSVVWILHDKRFNRNLLSSAEHRLRMTPCYFTNMDAKGKGLIYDQFEVVKGHRRLFKGPPLPIFPERIEAMNLTHDHAPEHLQQRLEHWSHYVRGDLLDRSIAQDSFQGMLLMEARFKEKKKPPFSFIHLLKQGYLATLDWLLKLSADGF